jgi:ABC-type polysaccharide/polyol phosphate transport system ATPase subunit
VEIERGGCLGIVGENGSGKSTLLGILAGVLRPTEGRVRLGGRVSALLELGTGFNPEFTGRENILMNAAILGLTDAQTRRRIPEIERFAEIGEFVDRPVKTYSSGMFVRLAFAVAVHLDPDILIVDEALSVGDYFFQQRCIRKILQMKQQGRTIVFVSHDLEAVRALADRAIWMERGSVCLEGKPDEVVAKYLAAMVTRGHKDVMQEEPLGKPMASVSDDLNISPDAFERIPAFLCSIPNVDDRYGNGKARIEGIGIFNGEGSPTSTVSQGDRLCIRISVVFLDDVEHPNIGFMLRNRLGQDVTGTNVLFEGQRLEPARAGDRLSVDFVMDLPFLHSGFYYFSPAIADGELNQYDMCDWIDNACAVNVLERSTTYGHLRIPVRVRVIPARKILLAR